METFFNDERPRLYIMATAADYLSQAAKWGKFLAIVGFVVVGLMVLMGLFAGATLGASLFDSIGNTQTTTGIGSILSGGVLTGFYLLFALLYFLPIFYLYRFSSKARLALNEQSEAAINEAFKNLKSLLKFMGILTIVFLAFYGLALLFVVLGMGIGKMM